MKYSLVPFTEVYLMPLGLCLSSRSQRTTKSIEGTIGWMFTGKFVLICVYFFFWNVKSALLSFLATHFKENYFRRECMSILPKMVANYQEKLLCCLLMCQTKHEKHLPFYLNNVYRVTDDIDEWHQGLYELIYSLVER